jgi:hypothetical protein
MPHIGIQPPRKPRRPARAADSSGPLRQFMRGGCADVVHCVASPQWHLADEFRRCHAATVGEATAWPTGGSAVPADVPAAARFLAPGVRRVDRGRAGGRTGHRAERAIRPAADAGAPKVRSDDRWHQATRSGTYGPQWRRSAPALRRRRLQRTAASVTSRARSMMPKPSDSSSSLMTSGGLVKKEFQRTKV